MTKISDEIRDFVRRSYEDEYMDPKELIAIADRADRETVELPRDKDWVPIHVGDVLRGCDAVLVNVFTTVEELRFDGRWEIDTTFGCITEPRLFVHDSPDSWERIAYDIETVVPIDDEDDERFRRELADRIRRLAKEQTNE